MPQIYDILDCGQVLITTRHSCIKNLLLQFLLHVQLFMYTIFLSYIYTSCTWEQIFIK